jgi:hypothetical protein
MVSVVLFEMFAERFCAVLIWLVPGSKAAVIGVSMEGRWRRDGRAR